MGLRLTEGERVHLQAEIVRRVAAGETIVAVCLEPGMPHPGTVHWWRARDPEGFGAQLGVALRRGGEIRRLRFDPQAAAAYLDGLRAGKTVHEMRSDPAGLTAARLRHWRAQDAPFGEEYRRLTRARQAQRGLRRRHGAATNVEWSTALGERVLRLAGLGHSLDEMRGVDPRLPTARGIRRWRREQPQFDADLVVNLRMGRLMRGKARRRAAVERLCRRLAQGGTINTVAGRRGLPTAAAFYAWIARSSELAEMVQDAYRLGRRRGDDAMLAAATEAAARGAIGDLREANRLAGRLVRRRAQGPRLPGRRWL